MNINCGKDIDKAIRKLLHIAMNRKAIVVIFLLGLTLMLS